MGSSFSYKNGPFSPPYWPFFVGSPFLGAVNRDIDEVLRSIDRENESVSIRHRVSSVSSVSSSSTRTSSSSSSSPVRLFSSSLLVFWLLVLLIVLDSSRSRASFWSWVKFFTEEKSIFDEFIILFVLFCLFSLSLSLCRSTRFDLNNVSLLLFFFCIFYLSGFHFFVFVAANDYLD